jgi:hypothetical protein
MYLRPRVCDGIGRKSNPTRELAGSYAFMMRARPGEAVQI